MLDRVEPRRTVAAEERARTAGTASPAATSLDGAITRIIDVTACRVADELDQREQRRIAMGLPSRTHGASGVPTRSVQPIDRMSEAALAGVRLNCVRLALKMANRQLPEENSTAQVVLDGAMIAAFVLDGNIPVA